MNITQTIQHIVGSRFLSLTLIRLELLLRGVFIVAVFRWEFIVEINFIPHSLKFHSIFHTFVFTRIQPLYHRAVVSGTKCCLLRNFNKASFGGEAPC